MITKQIIHLKNVVVFKILIYFLIFVFFFVLFPFLQTNLKASVEATENAKIKLQDLENKIVFVNSASSTIHNYYNKYLDLKKEKFDLTCFIKQSLNESYLQIAKDIGVGSKPVLYSSASPMVKKFNNNRNIEILTTDISSVFMSKTLSESLRFIEEFYKILPEYSIINSIDINMEEIITPESLSRLSPDVTPSLIKNKVNMKVRKVNITE